MIGGEVDENQRYISPTVFTGIKPSDPIMESEVCFVIYFRMNVKEVKMSA